MTPRGRKARALLAVVVTHAERQIDREALVGLLWSDRAPQQGRASLRQCLVELRTACAPLLNITPNIVGLMSDQIEVLTTSGEKELLSGLNHIDPAFDRWLVALREQDQPADRSKVGITPDATSRVLPGLLRYSRRLVVVTVTCLLCAAGAFLAAHFLQSASGHAPPSVLVRSFKAVSRDQWAGVAADRLADDIVARMPQVEATREAEGTLENARSSAIKASDWVVEGEVRAQPSPSVQARIVSREGTTLWSRVFDAPISRPGKLEGDVAAAVATLITCAAGSPMRSHADAATAILLAACDAIGGPEGWTGEGSLPALRRFAEAVPDDALPHALLGTALAMAAVDAPEPLAGQERSEANSELAQATRIDRSTGMIYLGRSFLVPRSAPLQERETLLLRGLKVDPNNAYLNLYMADFLAGVGRNDAAASFARRALAMDPARPEFISETAQLLAQGGRPRMALQMLDKADEEYSASRILTGARFTILLRGGDPAGARAVMDRASMVPGFIEPAEQASIRDQSYAIERPHGKAAEEIARDLVAKAAADPGTASRPVLVLANLGRTNAAIDIALRETLVINVLFRPSSRGLLMDRRFPMVAKRQGLWTYWQSTRRWPDICREPQLPWRCAGS